MLVIPSPTSCWLVVYMKMVTCYCLGALNCYVFVKFDVVAQLRKSAFGCGMTPLQTLPTMGPRT